MPTAIIAGATGLTGQATLKQLIKSQHYTRIISLERRASTSVSSDYEVQVVDFDHLSALPALPNIDDAYCCLGTTIKKSGSKAAFRKVDFDAVIHFAKRAREAGAKQFLVVSALGANAASPIFYNRVKAEMENALTTLGFNAVHIFQPALLLGERTESRLIEGLSIIAFKIITPLLLGRVRKYRPIHVDVIAKAMLKAATSSVHGVRRYESDEIQEMGSSNPLT
jgi:uncharacterized protein YbjT (DUF2867 family)